MCVRRRLTFQLQFGTPPSHRLMTQTPPPPQNAADTVTHRPLSYRPDIDGMRALAVLAVVAYHYAPTKFPGGFIGVDIFFVISGYLITGILLQAFQSHTFSLLDFYRRRILRIFPALSAVLIVCLVAGWLLLFPAEYATLGKHVAAGAGFVQNLVLWQEAGYFDTSALQKPLLHLWSLAVEEQFYIFWPLFLWLVLHKSQRVLASVLLIAALSFALNIWGIQSGNSVATFYLPLTRAWELMAGAGLAALHISTGPRRPPYSSAMSCIGLGLILLGFAVIHPGRSFPGFWGLLPVIGSVLLIQAGEHAFVNRQLLALRPMVAVGLISYPLYLWHWSLLSLASVIFSGMDHAVLRGTKWAALCLSFLLAWATYRWLERPIRRQRKPKAVLALGTLATLAGGAGLVIWQLGGLPQRSGSLVQEKAAQLLTSMQGSPEAGRCFDLTNGPTLPQPWSCELGDTHAQRWIMAYGDSHALSMLPALDRYGKEKHVRIVFGGLSGCPGLLGIEPHRETGPACSELANQAFTKVETKRAAAAILIVRWSYYAGGTTRPDEIQTIHTISAGRELTEPPKTGMAALQYGLATTLARYQATDIPILLMEDNPQQITTFPVGQLRFGSLTEDNLNASSVSRAEHDRNQASFNQLLQATTARYSVASLLNADQALCNADHCPWVKNSQILYLDDDHLSIAGSMLVYPSLANALNRILKNHHGN